MILIRAGINPSHLGYRRPGRDAVHFRAGWQAGEIDVAQVLEPYAAAALADGTGAYMAPFR
jgi:hypothetical protein